jgi:hypothetical protein
MAGSADQSDSTATVQKPLSTSGADDDREKSAAKYREKVDQLNRSRDAEIERALTLRACR